MCTFNKVKQCMSFLHGDREGAAGKAERDLQEETKSEKRPEGAEITKCNAHVLLKIDRVVCLGLGAEESKDKDKEENRGRLSSFTASVSNLVKSARG